MVEDKDAIRELLHRYCFYMDEGRFTELAALFTDDGEWIAPYRNAKGPRTSRRGYSSLCRRSHAACTT